MGQALAYVARSDAVQGTADDDQHRGSHAEGGEELRDQDEPDPSDPEVGDRSEPPRGASIQTRFRTIPESSSDPDGYEAHDASRPGERNECERRVRPGDEDEDHRVVEPPSAQSSRGASPWIAVVEGACAEHRRKRDRVHPHGEALEIPIGEHDEERAGDDSRDECVEMEDTAESRLQGLGHRPMMPNPSYVCGMRASSAAASASRTDSSSTRSRTSWKKPRTISRSASARDSPRVMR